MERSSKEFFMKRVGQWLGAGYRFHRHAPGNAQPLVFNALRRKGKLQYMPCNFKRRWSFEWWRKIPGNPLNRWSSDLFGKERLPRSECVKIDIPDRVRTKDEAVDYVLFESGFLDYFGKPNLKSYEALDLAMHVSGVSRVPYVDYKRIKEKYLTSEIKFLEKHNKK